MNREEKLAKISEFLDRYLDKEKLLLLLEDGTSVSILALDSEGTASIEDGVDNMCAMQKPLTPVQVDSLYTHVQERIPELELDALSDHILSHKRANTEAFRRAGAEMHFKPAEEASNE